MKIGVVIVNHDRRQLLVECLESLAAGGEEPVVIVVDNGSADGSARGGARGAPRAPRCWCCRTTPASRTATTSASAAPSTAAARACWSSTTTRGWRPAPSPCSPPRWRRPPTPAMVTPKTARRLASAWPPPASCSASTAPPSTAPASSSPSTASASSKATAAASTRCSAEGDLLPLRRRRLLHREVLRGRLAGRRVVRRGLPPLLRGRSTSAGARAYAAGAASTRAEAVVYHHRGGTAGQY